MEYREELPPDCPPQSASEIVTPTVRYRLLTGTTPEERDFDSYIKIKGTSLRSTRRTLCDQHGVSLWIDERSARRLFESAANEYGRWQGIARLTIDPEQGKLNQVETRGHQTWWPSKEGNFPASCTVIT